MQRTREWIIKSQMDLLYRKPLPQSSGTIAEEAARQTIRITVQGDWNETVSSGHGRIAARLTSQRP